MCITSLPHCLLGCKDLLHWLCMVLILLSVVFLVVENVFEIRSNIQNCDIHLTIIFMSDFWNSCYSAMAMADRCTCCLYGLHQYSAAFERNTVPDTPCQHASEHYHHICETDISTDTSRLLFSSTCSLFETAMQYWFVHTNIILYRFVSAGIIKFTHSLTMTT